MDSLQSSPMVFFLFPLLLFVIVLIYLHKTHPHPPGPKGYPIIGSMTMMDQLTHRGLARLAKRYGGLLHLQMGWLHIMAVSTPEMAREFLQVQDVTFANRPANMTITYLSYDRADMAFANYGPFWRQMRKICVMKLFSRKRAESWASVREEIDSMLQTVMRKAGSPVNIGELVFALAMKITYRAAFGSFSNEGQSELVKILQEFSKLFGAFDITDCIPLLSLINSQNFAKRLAKARGSLDRFIDKIMDEHMLKKKNNKDLNDKAEADTDMVDELMAFYREDGIDGDFDDSQSTTVKLTRDNIKSIIMDVMFGGVETVASAIEWAMAELMKNPQELKKVQQELTDVVGLNRHIHESDIEKLPYLRSAIKETLRLHPPIPVSLHEAAADSVVSGFKIPAGSRIMINTWAIGRDPNSWVDPDSFNPSRFMKDGAPDFKGSNFEFIPFGSG
ncbi:p450 domain-containing protein, partial [Cephalotus follicularis]